MTRPAPDVVVPLAQRVGTGQVGTIYLIHFSRPFGHARHYLGWTSNLAARLAHHRAGTGSALMRAVRADGISWELARTWTGDRHRERQLKGQGGRARLCPLCRGDGPAPGEVAPGVPDLPTIRPHPPIVTGAA